MKIIMQFFKNLKLGHVVLFLTIILVSASVYFSWKSPFVRAIRNGKRINALIIGTDWVDYARHSDTLVFAEGTRSTSNEKPGKS